MTELIILAIVILVLNILDSTTTALCFRQYPDKELKGESNPWMRWLMLKNKKVAEIFKQIGVIAIVIYLVANMEVMTLKVITLMFGFVVLNNTFVLLSRHITHRRIDSPLSALRKRVHVPNWATFYIAVVIFFILAYLIASKVW